MPALPHLDDFPHVEQAEDSVTCVPDCLHMVCQYWEIDKEWDEIASEVGYSAINGTPFENVGFLSDARVLWVPSLDAVEDHLAREPPRPLVAGLVVDNEEVLGWYDGAFQHAVVVVSIDAARVGLIDPLSRVKRRSTEPFFCDRSAFEQAWLGGWIVLPIE